MRETLLRALVDIATATYEPADTRVRAAQIALRNLDDLSNDDLQRWRDAFEAWMDERKGP